MGGHVVVTGVAGFIGSHLAEALVERGNEVVGIDCFTVAYPPAEKRRNLERLLPHPAFRLVEGDLVTLALDAWWAASAASWRPPTAASRWWSTATASRPATSPTSRTRCGRTWRR